MFKKILIVLLILIVAIAIGLYLFSGKLDGIIKETIEVEGTAALGSQVRVSNVVTNLKQGRAEISGLTISNPPGYQSANAIELSNFNAEVDYGDQTVKEIIINQPVINAEQKGKRNNFQDLLARMPKSEAAEDETRSESGPDITIKKIALQKATINLLTRDLEIAGESLELGNRRFIMDDFVVTNISGTPQAISDELTQKLVAHVSGQVTAYVTKEITNMAKAKATEKLKEEAKKALTEKLGVKLEDDTSKEAIGEQLKDKLKGKLKLKGF